MLRNELGNEAVNVTYLGNLQPSEMLKNKLSNQVFQINNRRLHELWFLDFIGLIWISKGTTTCSETVHQASFITLNQHKSCWITQIQLNLEGLGFMIRNWELQQFSIQDCQKKSIARSAISHSKHSCYDSTSHTCLMCMPSRCKSCSVQCTSTLMSVDITSHKTKVIT